MYVGTNSLTAVSHVLNGYLHGRGDKDSFDGWQDWVELRFGISHTAWHWTRILLHHYGANAAVLSALPNLYAEFLSDREQNGVEKIKTEHRARFHLADGVIHVPASTATAPLDQNIVHKDEIVRYLEQCEGNELADILRQVFATRPEGKDEGLVAQNQMVFGVASRENQAEDEGVIWGPWIVHAVAYFNPAKYPDGDFRGDPFVQFGNCANCNLPVCSHVKNALCPVCNEPVYLT